MNFNLKPNQLYMLLTEENTKNVNKFLIDLYFKTMHTYDPCIVKNNNTISKFCIMLSEYIEDNLRYFNTTIDYYDLLYKATKNIKNIDLFKNIMLILIQNIDIIKCINRDLYSPSDDKINIEAVENLVKNINDSNVLNNEKCFISKRSIVSKYFELNLATLKFTNKLIIDKCNENYTNYLNKIHARHKLSNLTTEFEFSLDHKYADLDNLDDIETTLFKMSTPYSHSIINYKNRYYDIVENNFRKFLLNTLITNKMLNAYFDFANNSKIRILHHTVGSKIEKLQNIFKIEFHDIIISSSKVDSFRNTKIVYKATNDNEPMAYSYVPIEFKELIKLNNITNCAISIINKTKNKIKDMLL